MRKFTTNQVVVFAAIMLVVFVSVILILSGSDEGNDTDTIGTDIAAATDAPPEENASRAGLVPPTN